MRDFSWKYFTMTGDVGAYLLYKEIDQGSEEAEWEEEQSSDEEQVVQG